MKLLSAMLLTVALPAPSQAQSIFDTLKQLKETARQLGGKRTPPPATNAAASAGGPESSRRASPDQDAELVPASALAEDATDSRLENGTIALRKVETFDVLGFRLGMTPREVARVAGRQHFRRGPNDVVDTTGSFEVEATALANQQLNRPTTARSRTYLLRTEGSTPDGSHIALTFTLEPSGPRLSLIQYRARLNGMTKAQFAAALVKKYGPYLPGGGSFVWVNPPATLGVWYPSPSLFGIVSESSASLDLSAAQKYRDEMKRRLEARAQQIAASKGSGVRF